MKTFEMLLEEQDSKAFALLKKMLERPALYLGINRLDYLYEFMNGYTFDRFEQNVASGNHDNEFNIMPDKELQYWLLHTQMATLHSGQMHGRLLFFRCFGTRQLAFDKYKEFLHAPLPIKQDAAKYNGDSIVVKALSFFRQGVDVDLYTCESNHDLVRYDWEDDIPADFYDNMAKSLIADVEMIVKSAGFEFDKLHVYIRREPLFTQVRFLFHSSDGWHDDTMIIDKPENYEFLIGITAKARNCKTDAFKKIGCDVFEQVDFSNSFENCEISDICHLIADEKTFLHQYQCWKERIQNGGKPNA